MPRVLVVEDHAQLAKMLAEGLQGAGYDTDIAGTGLAALARVESTDYDAMVLDWMLPELDGIGVLKRLRADGYDLPVVMLTARDAVDNRVTGLDSGADDYLVKPFELDELLARLRAVTRRSKGGSARVIEIADLKLDTGSRTVHRGGKEIVLSSREYAVLECLALNRGGIVSREQLVTHAYDVEEEPESNVIDVFIGHLRRKIDREFEPKLIHTRRGLGYLLGVPE